MLMLLKKEMHRYPIICTKLHKLNICLSLHRLDGLIFNNTLFTWWLFLLLLLAEKWNT